MTPRILAHLARIRVDKTRADKVRAEKLVPARKAIPRIRVHPARIKVRADKVSVLQISQDVQLINLDKAVVQN